MSMGPFAGLPGKIKTLLDLLTPARAGNLDHLDASVSTRATSSEVAKASVWPQSLANQLGENLDAPVSGIKSGQHRFQVFTSNGTWIRPAGVDYVTVTIIGGGGGGGGGINFVSNVSSIGGGCGGGSGEIVYRMPLQVTGNRAVVVGNRGLGGAAAVDVGTAPTTAGNGTAGTQSSFSPVSAEGGGGGEGGKVGFVSQVGSANDGGPGGQSSRFTLLGPRQAGEAGESVIMQASSNPGGDGGGSIFGSGGAGGATNGAQGQDVPSDHYGGGGGGGFGRESSSTNANRGGNGCKGIVMVEWWE